MTFCLNGFCQVDCICNVVGTLGMLRTSSIHNFYKLLVKRCEIFAYFLNLLKNLLLVWTWIGCHTLRVKSVQPDSTFSTFSLTYSNFKLCWWCEYAKTVDSSWSLQRPKRLSFLSFSIRWETLLVLSIRFQSSPQMPIGIMQPQKTYIIIISIDNSYSCMNLYQIKAGKNQGWFDQLHKLI